MERETIPRHAFKGVLSISSHLQPKMLHNDNVLSIAETTYWGVLCRSCAELVAFDVSPHRSFGPVAGSVNAGSIRCTYRHVHTYFPRDFQFFFSQDPISELAMKENREAYRAINPTLQASSNLPKAFRQSVDEGGRPVTLTPVTAGSADSSQGTIKFLTGWFTFVRSLLTAAISARIGRPAQVLIPGQPRLRTR